MTASMAREGPLAAATLGCEAGEKGEPMRCLVTGSSGHLGEALVRTLLGRGDEVIGVDRRHSPHTTVVGSIADAALVRDAMQDVEVVLHVATLHKPHVVTHPRREFIDTNVVGTSTLLEAAVEAGVRSFVFTSTTSTFGRALTPTRNGPAVWVTERTVPRPRNIYGASKLAAEHLAEEVHHTSRLPVVVLRTSRFFPPDDVAELRTDAGSVVARLFPEQPELYSRAGWVMQPSIDRVYSNARARDVLGWEPRFGFAQVLERLRSGQGWPSPLTHEVGIKGYHDGVFQDGIYPVG